MKITVKKGGNNFLPWRPTLPHFRKVFSFQFKLGIEWWEDDLTEPLIFGCKTPAVGRINYHRSGANWAIVHESGEVYLYPRYYAPISSGKYDGHELKKYATVLQPETWYRCTIYTDTLAWWLDGILIHHEDLTVSHWWVCPPFLGASGKDLNFSNDNSTAAVARRDLPMEIVY